MPISRAIASAVSLWSPVTITLFSPAPFATRTASITSGRAGSIMPSRPTKVSSFSSVSGVGLSGTASSGRQATPSTRSAWLARSRF